MLPLSLDQGTVLKKIRFFLIQEGRDEDFIKQFSEGYCSGISTLWLYSKWLQTQPKTSEKPRDDYAWFKSTVEFIAGWDGQWALDEKEKKEQKDHFVRFISYIQYFQNTFEYLPIGQGEIDKSLEDTKGRRPRKEYSIAALLTLEQLTKLLGEEDIIKNGKLILITSHDHETALFKGKKSGKYFYFDPNNPKGEVQTISIDELASFIFAANEFDPSKPSPIGMRMFSLDKKIEIYPPQEEVLNRILGLTLIGERGYADGSSGLMHASRIGCLESVQYYLAKKVDLGLTNKDGLTALMLAADEGHVEVVKVLLSSKDPTINLNFANKDGLTALMLAARRGYAEVIKLLLDSQNPKVNLDSISKDGLTALMLAAAKGHAEVVKVLLDNEDPKINLDFANKDGWTALMIAAVNGRAGMVKVLLDSKGPPKVDPNLVNKDGWTALMLAKQMKKDEIVKILKEKTAAGLLAKSLGGVLSQLPKKTPVQQSKISQGKEEDKLTSVKQAFPLIF